MGYLQDLQGELERVSIVAPSEVPSDVITMNSSGPLTVCMRAERTELSTEGSKGL